MQDAFEPGNLLIEVRDFRTAHQTAHDSPPKWVYLPKLGDVTSGQLSRAKQICKQNKGESV